MTNSSRVKMGVCSFAGGLCFGRRGNCGRLRMSAERDSCDSSPYLMVSQCATDMGEGRVWRERRGEGRSETEETL